MQWYKNRVLCFVLCFETELHIKREKWRIFSYTKEIPIIVAGKLNEKWEYPEKKNARFCKKKKVFTYLLILLMVLLVATILEQSERQRLSKQQKTERVEEGGKRRGCWFLQEKKSVSVVFWVPTSTTKQSWVDVVLFNLI